MKKRFISMLLVLCMVFTLFPSAAFAQEDTGIAIGTSGVEDGTPLCENHKAHTADCGYAEAVEGAVCTHECELCKDINADACVCEVLCTENLMNPDCKVCAAEGADMTKCTGKTAEKPLVCICEIKCTPTPECICPPVDSGELVHGEDCPLSDPETAAAQINPDCPLCAAQGADLTQCVGAAAMMAMPRTAIGGNFDAFITVDGQNVLCTFKVLTNNTVQVGKETIDGNPNGAVAQAIDKTLAGVVVIPGTVSNGGVSYTVTAIGKNAFLDCSVITGVNIPDSVTAIGNRAFYGCRALTSVTIPPTVKTIDDFAFFHCYALDDLAISEGVETIGESAFEFCKALKNVTIPSSVTSIGNTAFANCEALKNVTISEGVKSIGNNAFSNCDLLTKVVLPKTAPTVAPADQSFAFSPGTKLYLPADATGYNAGNWTASEYKERFVTLLTFTDSDSFNIPASKMGVAIAPINVSGAVKGGKSPYYFRAPDLPEGITIDSSTGIISGTPTAAGEAKKADISVSDQSVPQQKATITIACGAVESVLPPIAGTFTIYETIVKGERVIIADNPVLTAGNGGSLNFQYKLDGGTATPGRFYQVTPEGIGKTIIFEVTSTKAYGALASNAIVIAKEAGPGAPTATLNYVMETVNTETTWQYKVGSGEWKDCTANMRLSDLGWGGTEAVSVTFRVKETATHEAGAESAALNIPVRPAPLSASTFIITKPSAIGVNDGKLAGITSTMEYRKSDETNYTPGTGAELTGIDDGTTYLIRVKATDASFASGDVAIIVSTKDSLSGEIVINNGGAKGDETSSGNPSIIFGDYIMPRIVTDPQADAQLRYQWKIDGVAHGDLYTTVDAAKMRAPKESVGKAITLEVSDANGKYAPIIATSSGNVAKRNLTMEFQVSVPNGTAKYGTQLTMVSTPKSDYLDKSLNFNEGIGKAASDIVNVGSYILDRDPENESVKEVDKYYNTTFTPVNLNVVKADVDYSIATDVTSQGGNRLVTITVTAKNKDVSSISGYSDQPAKPTLTSSNGIEHTLKEPYDKAGVWTATYILPASVPGNSVTFTATYTDATGNYNDPVEKTLTKVVTVPDKSAVSVSLAVDKSSPTYGDSVTLTAEVQKENEVDPGTVTGTVQFKVGGTDIGSPQTLQGDMAALTVDKTTLKAAAGGKEYAFTAEFTSTDADVADGSSNEMKVTVAQKSLTVSISCAGKVWDDNTTATVIYSVSGVVSGDTVTAGGTSALYDSADVGTGKTVTATGITLGGADAGNYSCNDTATAANIAITKKPLTGSMISIADGTYTGSEIKPEPVVTDGVPSKITKSDYTIGYQNNINGGTATVVITATEDGNYSGTATKDFTIKKGSYAGAQITGELSVRAMKAADVKFDLSQIALPNGFVNGVYSNPQSGINKDGLVTTTTFEIENNIFSFTVTSKPDGNTAIIKVTLSSDNYEDVTVEITVTAREKTSLNISIPDYDKTYDGEEPTFDASQVVLTDPSGNIVTGVKLERIYFKDEYEDDYVIDAPPKDAGNYRIRIKIPDNHDVYEGSAFKGFKIEPKELTVSVACRGKTYDGTDAADAASATYTLQGMIGDDKVTVANATATYASKDAGSRTVTARDITLGGDDAANYKIPSATATTTATISKAALTGGTIDAGESKPYDATTSFTGVKVAYTGGVNGENVTGAANGTVADASAGAGKQLTVTGLALYSAFESNYTLPANNTVTGSIEIAKIDPAITVAAPGTGMAGKDVTVTVKITNPAGATVGFPTAGEITLASDSNATLKTALAAVSGKPGEYAATYTIQADAAKSTTITFTATVPTATTNYNADSIGTSAVLTVSDKRGTQTTLIADKASVTYGESTTLTATVQKATAGDPGTPAGTVQFKVGGNNIGTAQTLTNGKATLTVDKAALQAASGGKTYSFTAEFTATGNYADSTSSPATVTVAQKPLTIRAKNQFTYQNKTTLPTPVLEYDGLVDGETITGYTAAHSVSDTKTFGTFDINVTGSTADKNYAVTTKNGRLTIYEDTNRKDPPVTELPGTPADKPIVVAEPSDPAKQLRVITAVLAEEEAEPAANWLLTQPEVKPDDLMESHEVEMQVSTDGGTTWRKATMADVKAGKVKVALPLPAGTDPTTHSYIIYHFANGADSPANESFTAPDYNASSKTLSATVTSLSPFVVVATPKGGGNNTDDSSSRNDDEYDFWMTVKKNTEKAASGDVVKVSARSYDKIPSSVMEALRESSGVSMIITWGGKTITIPAGKAQKKEPGRIYWPLSKLAELYAGIGESTVLAPVNPETGGSGRHIPVTGGADIVYVPVGGGSTITAEAPEIRHDPAIPTTIREQAITPPDAGFEVDAYAGTPDAKGAGSMNAVAFAGFAVLLAALCGGIWFRSRKARAKEQ